MVRLDADQVLATIVPPMQRLTWVARSEIEVWPYVEALPDGELGRYSIDGSDVECVYRSADDRFDHVLIPTSDRPTYLVTIVDRGANEVLGHHVMDVTDQYGPPDARARR